MADDRSPYSPRRASSPGSDDAPATSGAGGSTPGSSPTSGSTPTPGSAPGTAPDADRAGRFTEDEARPIFREDAADADAATVRTPAAEPSTVTGASAAGATDAPAGSDDPHASDAGDGSDLPPARRPSRLNFTPRARPDDEDATTLLPATTGRDATSTVGHDPDDLDDLDDGPRRLGRRGRMALLAAAVVAVIVVGLVVGRAVLGVGGEPGATGDPGASSASSSAAGTPSAAALLDDASMLTPEGARPTDPKRTWTVGATTRGPVPAGSGPACLGSDPLEGAPTPQQTISRTLTSDGNEARSALHVAQAYQTPADATQAFAVTARALGTCSVPGDWIFTGRGVTGVGDESAAVAVHSTADGKTTQHWVVVSRTGRAVDVLDASTPGKTALNVNNVTASLASVVGAQCSAAGGTCPTTPATTDAPPPVGGDEPGFLATGDLPPAGSSTAPWVGTPVEPPSEDFTGSQCESVNWSTTAAADRSSRVYLLQDVPGIFGLNEIVLTARDEAGASKLVDKVKSDWASCKERKLTASVDSPTKVTGVATDGAKVEGWTTEVEQKAGSTTTRFRVGVAASGTKVAFVFLNPQKGLDVDSDDWNVVAVRAVQRMTQQS
ncbi:hypothetical protein [Microlunatus flavus]|uniref:Uncharacterized protein n=1 Tax=Microlunatus flavus TaxID=1036181 RepID=A0A1H9MA91_9ACTN|nr:hypothetical protein [Microlunatus flavus]SER20501.1 hypothetical protein SAMN05421756_11020 [Microlunatus flavus]